MTYSEALALLPEKQRPIAVAHFLALLNDGKEPQTVNYDPCFRDRLTIPPPPSPTYYEGVKTADAIERALESAGQPATDQELIQHLQSGGCKIAQNPKFVLRNLRISIGSYRVDKRLGRRPRFYVEGMLVGLAKWRERKGE